MEYGSNEYLEAIRRHNPYLPKGVYSSTADDAVSFSADPLQHNVFDIDDLERLIYRIIPFEQALRNLEANELTLTRTRKWDDPFENYLLRAKVRSSEGKSISLLSLREQYFGQCWTLVSDSDAMWRIYSPSKNAIKLCTSVRKLFSAFYDFDDPTACVSQFLGLVRYVPEEGIIRMMKHDPSRLLLDPTGLMLARTLMVKRLEFSHEAEVRLIRSYNKDHPDCSKDHPSFTVDWNNVFDELVTDPRGDPANLSEIEQRLRAAGYSGRVTQSPLYRLPTLDFVLDGTRPPEPSPRAVWDRLMIGEDTL